MPYGILTPSVCTVNENSTKNCTKSINFADPEINDVLESIRILLNYIKKYRELQLRARTGDGASVYGFAPREK
jgi:hypothetical protein